MFSKNIIFIAVSFFILLMVIFPVASYSQDGTLWIDYSSKGNPQATGHNFTLQYSPYYVESSDFSKEDYLQTFIIDDEEGSGDSFLYLTVGIHDLPNGVASSSLKSDGLWDIKKLSQLWDVLAKETSSIKTMKQAISWDNIPMVKFSTNEIKDGILFLSGILFALHGDKLIKLECGMNTFGSDDPEFAAQDYSANQTCRSYFNSLQFIDSPLP
jgi:hypothetical protein